jgi:hypothetical protein
MRLAIFRNSRSNPAAKLAFTSILLLTAGLALSCIPRISWAQSEGTLESVDVREGTIRETNSLTPTEAVGAESRTRLSGSGWSQFKRNLGLRFFNFTSAAMEQVGKDGGRLESYNYFSLQYRLSRTEAVAVRPAFFLNSGGSDYRGRFQESEFEWSDLYINYANYGLRFLPFELDYVANLRLYLPTSEASQTRGMIARIRPYFIVGAPLTSRLTYSIHFQPDFYIQSRTGYANDRGFAAGNRNYGYKVFGELSYRLNRTFSLVGEMGHDQMWHHSVPVENVAVYQIEEFNVGASVGINWKSLATAIGVTQARNVQRPFNNNNFSLFRDNETQYFARSYYRF